MKLKIESYLSSGGVRILTTTCPNGEECKVGSMACGRCGYHLRIEKGHVYCRFGRKQRKTLDESMLCSLCHKVGRPSANLTSFGTCICETCQRESVKGE